MSRNLILCCDGTSNEFGAENTSVIKLYSVLDRSVERQTFYDPGVGTFPAKEMLTRSGKRFLEALGLAFGLGLTRNVLEAYAFLMEHWEPADRIFVFGFSRGAYTARVLAGLIHKLGVLECGRTNLTSYADRLYKHEAMGPVVDGFKQRFSRPCRVHFLGLWDTVSSVGWAWDPNPQIRPFTTTNPSVDVVRHAVSIDERRAFFRQNRWGIVGGQDVKEVWFAGYHGDVGGHGPLHALALEWMLVEAHAAGLAIDVPAARALVANVDLEAELTDSLSGAWKVAEFVPKLRYDAKRGARRPHLNRFRSRQMREGEVVHESVLERMRRLPTYAPRNLLRSPPVEAWKRL